MSDRGLSVSELSALGRENVEYYYLIKMGFATELNYTLAPYDIDFDGDTYSSTGLVIKIPTITESLKIKPSTLPLEMSGASSFVQALALSDNYNNAEVLIYLYQPIENLLKYSEQFQNAVWTDPLGEWSVASNSHIAPDFSGVTADTITVDASDNSSLIRQVVTVTTGETYTFTAWIKLLSGTITSFNIDVGDGAIASVLSQLSTEWARVDAIAVAGAASHLDMQIAFSGASAQFVIWGAQLNNGMAKPYIKTESLTAEPTATQIFEGLIGGCSTVEDTGKGRSTVTWSIANHFSNWADKNTRLLNDDYQKLLFPGDWGLAWFGVTDYRLEYWGKYSEYPDPTSFDHYSGLILDQSAKEKEAFRSEAGEPLDTESFAVPVLYGTRRLAGVPVFRDLTGSYSQFLHVVYVLAEGECDSLIDITFNGASYTDAAISSFIDVHFHSGADAQTVDPDLDLRTNLWNSSFQLKGLCYVYIQYTATRDHPWGAGEPVPLFELKGKKIFDPRTSTTIYSTNPAIILRDYLSNTRIGKGIDVAKLSGVDDAADYCDVLVTEHDGGAGTVKRLTFEGYLDTGVSIKKNVEHILFAMRGHLPWANGLYYFIIERHDDASAYSFDDSNTGDAFDVLPVAKLNEVHYKYVDLALEHQENTVISSSASYKAEDNDRILKKAFFNKFENNQYRGKNRADTILKKSRENLRVSHSSARMDALNLICGNVIDVTRASKGWTAKEFRVEEIKIKPDGVIEFSKSSEFESTVYDWGVSVEAPLPVNTLLPNPFEMEAPEGLVMTSGTAHQVETNDGTTVNRMLVRWNHVSDLYKVDRFIVQYKETSDSNYIEAAVVTDIEEAVAGNGILQSETLASSPWVPGNLTGISSNVSNDSTGSPTLDQIVDNATSGQHYVYQNINSIVTAFDQRFSVCVEIKESSLSYAFVAVTSFAVYKQIIINLSTGAITLNTFDSSVEVSVIRNSAGLNIIKIENIPSGSSGTSTPRFTVYNAIGGSPGDSSYSGSGQGVDVGRVQCNLGSKLLPYATTATVAVEGNFYRGSIYIDNVTYDIDYDVRVAAYNGNNIKSDWLSGGHVVGGAPTIGSLTELIGTDSYENASFFHNELFTSSEGMLVGTDGTCWSLTYANALKVIQCTAGSAHAYRQIKSPPPGIDLQYFDVVTKWKAAVAVSGMAGVGAAHPLVAVGSTSQAGFEFQWSGTGINVYGYVYRGGTKYLTAAIVTNIADGSTFDLECVINPDLSVIFSVNSNVITYTANKLLSTDIMLKIVFYAVIPYDGTTGVTLTISEQLFLREP